MESSRGESRPDRINGEHFALMAGPPVPAIECSGLHKAYGGVVALDDVTIHLDAGEVLGVVGANGAGKTTLLNVLTGVVEADEGRLRVRGQEVSAATPAFLAELGVARTFQNVRLFPGLSVAENVRVALPTKARWNLWSALGRPPAERALENAEHDEAVALLERVGLADKETRDVGSLTYGERRLVEVARALARRPTVLLLDEPAAGVTEAEEERLAGVIGDLSRDDVLSLIVVEHRWGLLEECADRVIWMAEGQIACEGTPEEVFETIRKQVARRRR